MSKVTMWRSRWRCVIKPAYSVSFLLSMNIFVWQNVLYFLDAPRGLTELQIYDTENDTWKVCLNIPRRNCINDQATCFKRRSTPMFVCFTTMIHLNMRQISPFQAQKKSNVFTMWSVTSGTCVNAKCEGRPTNPTTIKFMRYGKMYVCSPCELLNY